MYREHLTNFNTAAIYDIYENIGGGYKHLYPSQLNFRGGSSSPVLP